jgi:hypothetical protein
MIRRLADAPFFRSGASQTQAAGASSRPFSLGRKKMRETFAFRPIFGETGPKSPMILVDSEQIPYAGEQGLYSVEQGIKFPARPTVGMTRAQIRRSFLRSETALLLRLRRSDPS